MQTLPKNLAENPNTADLEIEFVILNYNSQDGLHEWIMTDPQIQEEMRAGRIVYARTTDPEVFHMSHAKNMAHRLATGDVLINGDADNYAGHEFFEGVAAVFERNMNTVMTPSKQFSMVLSRQDKGFMGRIAISRDNFMALGGYDETFVGWGGEDDDFLRRARMAEIDYIQFQDQRFIQTIKHGNKERVANFYKTDEDRASAEQAINERDSVVESFRSNSRFANAHKMLKGIASRLPSIARLSLSANGGAHFGLGKVTIFKNSERPQVFEILPRTGENAQVFNSVGGAWALIEDRIKPTTISLTNLASQPSSI